MIFFQATKCYREIFCKTFILVRFRDSWHITSHTGSIVPMALSRTETLFFSRWPGSGLSRSPKITLIMPFDSRHIISYMCSIVTIALSHTKTQWSSTWHVDPFAKWCWGEFSLPLSYWVPRHAKSPRCLADTMPRFLLWAKIQYGRRRPLRKYNFFVFQAICKCSTSILTVICVRNSFLISFWRLEVIFTFTGHVQGHLFMSLTMRITYTF